MNNMKPLLLSLVVCASFAAIQTSHANWLTDYAAAQTQAQRENKPMLLDFTGSDWCGWCIKLDREVFSQPDFQSFAAQNLVLVEVDFPKRKAQSNAQKTANHELARRYKISGYPTLVLVDPQGNELARTGYRPGGPQTLIQELTKHVRVAPSKLSSSSPTPSARPRQDRPLYSGAPLQPPPKYEELELKGISGTPKRRFALINNQTFTEGEAAAVKFGSGQIKVQCVEIKEDSVIIDVGQEKERREIFLVKSH